MPSAALVDLVHQRSEGNAFLVEEIVGIVRSGGDPRDLPPSLRDLLLARVDALGAPAQRVVRTASVAGRLVSDRLLGAVTGLDGAELFAALREAVEHQLLVIDPGGRGYTFRHLLAREAVYDDMLPGERVALHAAYGEVLEATPGLADDDAGHAAALAYHWYAALDLPRALVASMTASRQATASYAPAEAQHHLERVLELWPRVPDAAERSGLDHVGVLERAATAAYSAGAMERGVMLLEQALTELPFGVDDVRRALLMERLVRSLRDLGRTVASLSRLEEALALLHGEETSPAAAVVLASLANGLMRNGDMAGAAEQAGRAVAAARAAGIHRIEADAKITSGAALVYLGTVEQGLAELRGGLHWGVTAGESETAMRGYINLSDVLEYLGRHEEAVEAAQAGLEVATRIGVVRTLGAYLVGNAAEPLLRVGRWSEADRLCADALAGALEGVFAGTLLGVRCEVAVLRGRYDEADRLLAALRSVIAEVVDLQFNGPAAFVRSEVERARGDLPAAMAVIAEVLRGNIEGWLGRYGWPVIWQGARLVADADTAARDRRQDPPPAAAELAALVDRMAGAMPAEMPAARGYRNLVRAETQRAAGSDGVPEWAAAAQAWRDAAEPYPLAYALLRLAEGACSTGDRSTAAAALGESLQLARRLGAEPLAAEGEALARRSRLPLPEDDEPAAPGPAPEQDPLRGLGLTDREREVLQLLAGGRSNPQVAQELFISVKTASVHVSNILAKLGVSSRGEAAAVAHRLGVLGLSTREGSQI